jgi:hypothetical protein
VIKKSVEILQLKYIPYILVLVQQIDSIPGGVKSIKCVVHVYIKWFLRKHKISTINSSNCLVKYFV